MHVLSVQRNKRFLVFDRADHGTALPPAEGQRYVAPRKSFPTHFLALKLDWVQPDKSKRAYDSFVRSLTHSSIPRNTCTDFDRLHLTIAVLTLDAEDKHALAMSLLRSLVDCPPGTGDYSLSMSEGKAPIVNINGLEIMKGTASHCHVLYSPVANNKSSESLIRFCEDLRAAFTEAGLELDRHSTTTDDEMPSSIKLHCTVANTRYLSKQEKTKRTGFDATRVIRQGLDLGDARLSLFHLSPLSDRATKPTVSHPKGYYPCQVELHLCE